MADVGAVAAILNESHDPSVREAMLLGSWLEGGWHSPYGVGDGGTSFGPFQIHLPAHPNVTRQEAENAQWAADYMYGAYVSGVTRVDPSLWVNDPEQAAEKAAYFAEGPAKIYHESRGQATVDAGWAATVSVMAAAGQQLGPGGAGKPIQGGSSIGGGNQAGGACTGTKTTIDVAAADCFALVVACKDGKITPGDFNAAVAAKNCPSVLGPTGIGGIDAPYLAGKALINTVEAALAFIFSFRFLEIVVGIGLVIVGVSALSKAIGGPSAGDAVKAVAK